MLSPVFAANITDSAWPTHLQRMVAFWSAVLFADKGFEGNPMQKHFSLPVNEHHFTQWLLLFRQTIDDLFAGPKAEEAKKRAASIAQIMLYKIQMLKP
jgi:hemoglobin